MAERLSWDYIDGVSPERRRALNAWQPKQREHHEDQSPEAKLARRQETDQRLKELNEKLEANVKDWEQPSYEELQIKNENILDILDAVSKLPEVPVDRLAPMYDGYIISRQLKIIKEQMNRLGRMNEVLQGDIYDDDRVILQQAFNYRSKLLNRNIETTALYVENMWQRELAARADVLDDIDDDEADYDKAVDLRQEKKEKKERSQNIELFKQKAIDTFIKTLRGRNSAASAENLDLAVDLIKERLPESLDKFFSDDSREIPDQFELHWKGNSVLSKILERPSHIKELSIFIGETEIPIASRNELGVSDLIEKPLAA